MNEITITILFSFITCIIALLCYEKLFSSKRKQRISNQDELDARGFALNVQQINIQREQEDLHRLIEHNKGIVIENKKILNKNQVQLFHIKESAAVLYRHYSIMLSIIDDLNCGNGIDHNEINQLKNNVYQNLRLIDNYFLSTFNMTISQYDKLKTNIVARFKGDDSNGPGYMTDSSLN